MSLKILVTGGAGYIGSVLVPDLLSLGHKVTVVDSFMFNQTSLNQCAWSPLFEIVKGDVRSAEVMKPLIAAADVIIPLAALVGAPICKQDPIGATTINHDAIVTMLSMTSKNQVILMPTTNSAYGSGDSDNHCDESSPLRPISQYAKEKVLVEQQLMELPNATSFRLATVFGMSPRMRLDLLVNDFVYRAVNDRFVILFEAKFKRNYIHVKDVSRVFIHALENPSSVKGEVFNVGLSDANVSKQELCEKIQKHIPEFYFTEAPVAKDPDQRNYIVSNRKLENIGFKTAFSLDAGIGELIKGYKMFRKTQFGNI